MKKVPLTFPQAYQMIRHLDEVADLDDGDAKFIGDITSKLENHKELTEHQTKTLISIYSKYRSMD